ncbi:MAG TPA: hypothetical protein VKE74_35210 [Gemmataceae bacterium]|nr:hypothetical protein [Gemmataceae bacterium]
MFPLLFTAMVPQIPEAPPPRPAAPIDSLYYSFSDGWAGFGPTGSISFTRDGKVRYCHATAPSTGSGGLITQKEWEIPKDEVAALFRDLVADGLLELPEGGAKYPAQSVFVTRGRWQSQMAFDSLPEKYLARLRPYLEHAHPQLWKSGAQKPRDPLPDDLRLDTVTWMYASDWKSNQQITLTLKRKGHVKYVREERKDGQSEPVRVPVVEEWDITPAEAEKLLAGLVEDGLLESDRIVGGSGSFPRYWWEAKSGRWKTAGNSNENLEKIVGRLRPYLEKADPETWKPVRRP